MICMTSFFFLWKKKIKIRITSNPSIFLQMSHGAANALCRAIKLQCELYSTRQIAICLDPYCGLGFVLWCLCRLVVVVDSLLYKCKRMYYFSNFFMFLLSLQCLLWSSIYINSSYGVGIQPLPVAICS